MIYSGRCLVDNGRAHTLAKIAGIEIGAAKERNLQCLEVAGLRTASRRSRKSVHINGFPQM
jgi:hypothetical protein